MAISIILPKFNMNMDEGVLLRWLRRDGDSVEQGDPLCEVETDKVNMEVEAPADGILCRLQFEEGAHVPVTAVIAFLAADAAEALELAGDSGPFADVAEEEASNEAPGPGRAGLAEPTVEPSVTTPSAPRPEDPFLTGNRVRATPAVRRLARERGVELASIVDGRGRASMEALEAAIASKHAAGGGRPTGPSVSNSGLTPGTGHVTTPSYGPPAPAEDLPGIGTVTARAARRGLKGRPMPLDPTRRTIAERMMLAHQAPHITLVREVNVAGLVRARHAPAFETTSFTALFAAAVVRGLMAHPLVNSTFEEGQIVYHDEVNLGIAVARPEGLIVPVVPEAEKLTLFELASRISDLVGRARAGRLTVREVSDGTFTITSLGQAGVDLFSPLVNPPQVAVLGIGRITDRVAPIAGGIGVTPSVYLSLTCDHRVLDGEPGAAFLATLADDLEDPSWLGAGSALG